MENTKRHNTKTSTTNWMVIGDRMVMKFGNEQEHKKKNVWYFLVRQGRRGNLFAVLNRVVIIGSRGVGKRV